MCGIAGILENAADDALRQHVQGMTDTLLHRGPDDGGIWTDAAAGIALGHRRLAILDLSPAGHQPMHSVTGRYAIVFNGEIYNHLKLRRRLPNQSWRGHSDTETLLSCIEAWGIEATLERSIGMFAFAVWDRDDRVLTLARDRIGEKPLYYGWQGELFLFASELKAIKAHPLFKPEIDRDALTLLLLYNYIAAPFSIYKGICKLIPGTLLRIPVGQGLFTAQSKSYWSLLETAQTGTHKSFSGSETEMLTGLEQCLSDAVASQQVADVPLGAFLSGGIDSSLIVALMQARSSRPVKTFTIGFSEAEYNEAEHALSVARHLGTEHTEFHLSSAQALDVIPLLPMCYDEPFADSSQIPTALICQQARRHVTVALSGDGGDELFGGYNRYFWGPRIWHKVSWLPLTIRRLLANLITVLSPQQWDRLAQTAGKSGMLLGDRAHKLAARLNCVRDMDDLYLNLVSEWRETASCVRDGAEPETLLSRRRADWPDMQPPELRMMCLDALTYLPDDILVKVDRAAMAASLETRTPFLDKNVVEFAWSLPLAMKIRNDQGKWALRQLLYKYVPRQLVERPKQGFGVPLAAWLRGPLRDWAEALLDEARLRREGYFQPEPIRQRWQEHLSGRRNWEYSLWSVLMFQAWLAAQDLPRMG
ncbi:asparagine synthase (glutamine-hydrolyzing) [Desulfobulbus sp. F4]|nr:asparagine synthase (glutamine-hydrolyzing) [Desulfobulbus sp. F4]